MFHEDGNQACHLALWEGVGEKDREPLCDSVRMWDHQKGCKLCEWHTKHA